MLNGEHRRQLLSFLGSGAKRALRHSPRSKINRSPLTVERCYCTSDTHMVKVTFFHPHEGGARG